MLIVEHVILCITEKALPIKLWHFSDFKTHPDFRAIFIWVDSNKVDEPKAYYTKWSKSEKNKYHINAYIWNLERGTDEHIYRAAMEMQTQRTDF